MSDSDWACLISILCLMLFSGTVGFLLGNWNTKRFYEFRMETAEEKLRLAEHTWEMTRTHGNEEMRKHRLDRIKKYKEWEFYRARIPNGVPQDYNP